MVQEQVAEARALVKKAYAKLRKNGFIARGNFSWCSNCAGYELAGMCEKRGRSKVVYWHRQDEDWFRKSGSLTLRYGWMDGTDEQYVQVGQEVVEALKAEGLEVEWSGSANEVIFVKA